MNKLNYILILFIAIISISSVQAYWCYQESANVTNQRGTDGSCGLNYSGRYYSTSSSLSWKDGLFSTYDASAVSVYVNYSKPLNYDPLLGAQWLIKVGDPAATFYLNISYSCLNQTIVQLRDEYSFDAGNGFYHNLQCKNDNSWISMYVYASDYSLYDLRIYEEAILWYFPNKIQFKLTSNKFKFNNLYRFVFRI